MRPLRALLAYFVAVFIGGALLAPPLCWLVQLLAHHFPGLANNSLGRHVVGAPFHRFVDRALLGIALAGLWPMVKNLGFASASDLGLVRPRGQWKKLGGGFLMGFISLAAIGVIAFACHARHFSPKLSAARIVEKLPSAAATAIVVAVLEEILFRGALFGVLRKVFHWIFALIISSMVYAAVHYLESANSSGEVSWFSGLQLLPLMFRNLTDFYAIVPGFFNLTLAGVLLGWAYQRTGNLYFSIGLHSGWIFCIKIYDSLSVHSAGANDWWWGHGRLAIVNGWIALPVLVITLLVFARLSPGKERTFHP